jgi:hypothetical protein
MMRYFTKEKVGSTAKRTEAREADENNHISRKRGLRVAAQRIFSLSRPA